MAETAGSGSRLSVLVAMLDDIVTEVNVFLLCRILNLAPFTDKTYACFHTHFTYQRLNQQIAQRKLEKIISH